MLEHLSGLTNMIMKGSTMATDTLRAAPKGLQFKPHGDRIVQASRKTRWFVGDGSLRTVDQLSFTSRDAEGRINWWSVQPPKTSYWHVHEMLGRAYAFEVLDLLNNPSAEGENKHVVGHILNAIAHWLPAVSATAASGIADGFFSVIGEYVATGTATR